MIVVLELAKCLAMYLRFSFVANWPLLMKWIVSEFFF